MKKDVVIIGSGISGLICALEISYDKNILILTKEDVFSSNSILAQGGIAATLNQDEIEKHILDSKNAGNNLNSDKALKYLIQNSQEAIKTLEKYQVKFDKDENNQYELAKEGGHSTRRILHVGGDQTGKNIIEALINEVNKRENIQICEYHHVFKIKKNKVFSYDLSGDIVTIKSKAIVLATGGMASLYDFSTNDHTITGDGITLASDLGCEVDDLEYIQFHPTLFAKPESDSFLISEALRGEGGILRDEDGSEILKDIHPMSSLAPRDIVAREIFKSLKNNKKVYLDITHHDKEYLENRFPYIYEMCQKNGISIEKQLIPVQPAAHYTIGGIVTNILGETNVQGVYACGECSNTKVHGANRLASNSLLECVVFATNVAKEINKLNTKSYKMKYDGKLAQGSRLDIDLNLNINVGVIRNEEDLDLVYKKVIGYYKVLLKQPDTKVTINERLQVKAMILLIESCIENKESIGCHYRKDTNE